MPQEYRHLKCPGIDCPKVLRLSISEKHYGTKVDVTCPSCGAECRTTIPTPAVSDVEKPSPTLSDSFDWPTDVLESFERIFGKFKK